MAIGDHNKTDKLHRYILADAGHNKVYLVYRCMHPSNSCGHYLPADKAVGRDTICWRCGGICQIPKMRRNRYVKRPHCLDCTKVYRNRLPKLTSKPIDLKKLAEMTIEELMGDDALFDPEKKGGQ